MTVPSEQSRIQYTTDGTSVSFPVPFRFLNAAHLQVARQHNDEASILELGVDYSVSGVGNQAGGTITTTTTLPAGNSISIERVVPITQETAYQRNDPFPERAHEQALDKLTMICQMLGSVLGLTPGSINRALLLGASDIDGKGAYQANGNRIRDLGAPQKTTDAARKQDIIEALAALSTDESGQFVVERLADAVDPENGAGMILFGSQTAYGQHSIGGAVIRRVNSIEALRSLSGRFPLDTIILTGYHKGVSEGSGIFIWLEDSTEPDDNGFTIQALGGAWARVSVVIRPEDFGARGDGNNDTAALESSLRRALKTGFQIIASNKYSINPIDLSDAAGSLDFKLTGKISRLPSSSTEALISFGNKDSVRIYGGGTFDFNFQKQSEWVEGLTFDAVGNLNIECLNFLNAKASCIYTRSHYISSVVQSCNFVNGANHSGISGEYCIFLKTRGGISVRVVGNRFIQTANPLPGQSRNPGGFLNIDTGATQERAEGSMFLIDGNYFENLGHHCAGNLVSPLDFYSFVGSIHIKNNTLRKSRTTPIRTSAGRLISVSGNNISQSVVQQLDGGSLYLDAALISVSLIDRGYQNDNNEVSNVVIQNNCLSVRNGISCSGIIASGGSTIFPYRKISVTDNHISAYPESDQQAILIDRVKITNIARNDLKGFAQSFRIQNSNVPPLIADGFAHCTIESNRFESNDSFVYARDAVENLHIIIRDNVGVTSRMDTFTIRGVYSAVIDSNLFYGNGPGDVLNIRSFWMRDNNTNSTTPPNGYSGLPFFRITGNKGIPDANTP